MSKRIVWLSRHPPLPRQLAALKDLFPNCTLIHDTNTFNSAADIMARIASHAADEAVVVAPLLVTKQLLRLGLHPLWAEMQSIPCSDPAVEVRLKNHCYRFVRFHRITGISLQLSHPTEDSCSKSL